MVERKRSPRGDPGEEADSGSGDSSFGDGPGDGGEMPHTLGTADSSVLYTLALSIDRVPRVELHDTDVVSRGRSGGTPDGRTRDEPDRPARPDPALRRARARRHGGRAQGA